MLGQEIDRLGNTLHGFGSSEMQAADYLHILTSNWVLQGQNLTDHVDWPCKHGDGVLDNIYDASVGTAGQRVIYSYVHTRTE